MAILCYSSVPAKFNRRGTENTQLILDTILHRPQRLGSTASPGEPSLLSSEPANYTDVSVKQDAVKLRNDRSAIDWLSQIVRLKRAALESEHSSETTGRSVQTLKGLCGRLYCRFRTFTASPSTTPSPSKSYDLRLCYTFPNWLASRMVEIECDYYCTGNARVSWYRIVSSNVFQRCKSMNVRELRVALAEGRLGISDLDENGRKLLWVSSST